MLKHGYGKSLSLLIADRHLSCGLLQLPRLANSSITFLQVPPRIFRSQRPCTFTMAKRKSSSQVNQEPAFTIAPIPVPTFDEDLPPPKRRASQRKVSQPKPNTGSTNPDRNANVLDAPEALRASPDADEPDERMNLANAGMDVENQVKEEDNDSPLSEISDIEPPVEAKKPKTKSKAPGRSKVEAKDAVKTKGTKDGKDNKQVAKEPQFLDPEAEGDEEADEEEIQAALSRPPPVNSDYLPLPWRGRLGYVSLHFPLLVGTLIDDF